MIKMEKKGGWATRKKHCGIYHNYILSRNEERRANRLYKVSLKAVAAETVISLFISLLDFKCQVSSIKKQKQYKF